MNVNRYSPWLRRLHWLIALLIVAAWALSEARGYTQRGSDLRAAVTWTHIQFGLAVILLMLPRLLARLRSATPPITPPIAIWQAWLAKLMHLALYALAFLVPILGMAMQYTKGASWDLFGLPLPVSLHSATTPSATSTFARFAPTSTSRPVMESPVLCSAINSSAEVGSNCFMPRRMRRFSRSTPSTVAFTVWPTASISRG